MGSGVADNDTFTRILEDDLNRSSAFRGVKFEVLNFGVSAFALTQQLAMLNDRALRFRPDAVFVTDGEGVGRIVVQHLLEVSANNRSVPFPRIREVVHQAGIETMGNPGLPALFDSGRFLLTKAGVQTRMPWGEGLIRMRRAREFAVQATFNEIAELSRKSGAVPVFVALNTVEPPPARDYPAKQYAAAAGMLVFDLFDLWHNRDLAPLRVHISDTHANAAGNRLIAGRLRDLIQTKAAELRIGSASVASIRAANRY